MSGRIRGLPFGFVVIDPSFSALGGTTELVTRCAEGKALTLRKTWTHDPAAADRSVRCMEPHIWRRDTWERVSPTGQMGA